MFMQKAGFRSNPELFNQFRSGDGIAKIEQLQFGRKWRTFLKGVLPSIAAGVAGFAAVTFFAPATIPMIILTGALAGAPTALTVSGMQRHFANKKYGFGTNRRDAFAPWLNNREHKSRMGKTILTADMMSDMASAANRMEKKVGVHVKQLGRLEGVLSKAATARDQWVGIGAVPQHIQAAFDKALRAVESQKRLLSSLDTLSHLKDKKGRSINVQHELERGETLARRKRILGTLASGALAGAAGGLVRSGIVGEALASYNGRGVSVPDPLDRGAEGFSPPRPAGAVDGVSTRRVIAGETPVNEFAVPGPDLLGAERANVASLERLLAGERAEVARLRAGGATTDQLATANRRILQLEEMINDRAPQVVNRVGAPPGTEILRSGTTSTVTLVDSPGLNIRQGNRFNWPSWYIPAWNGPRGMTMVNGVDCRGTWGAIDTILQKNGVRADNRMKDFFDILLDDKNNKGEFRPLPKSMLPNEGYGMTRIQINKYSADMRRVMMDAITGRQGVSARGLADNASLDMSKLFGNERVIAYMNRNGFMPSKNLASLYIDAMRVQGASPQQALSTLSRLGINPR
jgi:hypothetical protein